MTVAAMAMANAMAAMANAMASAERDRSAVTVQRPPATAATIAAPRPSLSAKPQVRGLPGSLRGTAPSSRLRSRFTPPLNFRVDGRRATEGDHHSVKTPFCALLLVTLTLRLFAWRTRSWQAMRRVTLPALAGAIRSCGVPWRRLPSGATSWTTTCAPSCWRSSALTWIKEMQMSEPSPAEVARLQSDAQEQAELYREQVAEAERQAALEDRTETLLFADRQMGSPLSEMTRARAHLSEVQDEVNDLEERLEKAKAKLSRAQDNSRFWASRAEVAQKAVQRSASLDPMEAAVSRARQAHAEFAKQTRAAMRSAAAGERRPKGSGSDAVRGEPHLDCQHCRDLGATAEESFAIHHQMIDPPKVPAMANGQGYCAHGYIPSSCAECRSASRAFNEKVNDLVAKGYSREFARDACTRDACTPPEIVR